MDHGDPNRVLVLRRRLRHLVETSPAAAGVPVIARVSGDKEHPANFGRLCTKGATHADMLRADGRLTTALLRPARGDEPVPHDRSTTRSPRRADGCARSSTSTGRTRSRSTSPARCDSRRSTWPTSWPRASCAPSQIESNSRLCMASAGTGYKLSLGADGPPGSYDDFDHADVFFVIGSNMADCHPILFLRMMDRVKAGAKLIVVDPRRTATADKADLFLQIRPGTDLALLNGLLHLLVEDGDIDERVHRRAHRGLGGDARVPRRLPARPRSPDHRHRRGRHPHRRPP